MIVRSKKITGSAQGEDCTICIVGVCENRTDTTVFCHFPDESHGTGHKSTDLSGAYCCGKCHDVIDGRVKSEEFTDNKHFYLRRAQTRTIGKLIDKGVLVIA